MPAKSRGGVAGKVAQTSASAAPTKSFFISMLVRDVQLIDAIADLVDNSVDGARRLLATRAAKKSQSFDGLWVRLKLSATEFVIEDNCGGIPLEIAQKYAFRFGRPGEYPGEKGSIGEFGVGMKRALFKLGNHFTIESRHREARIGLDVKVDDWSKDAQESSKGSPDWNFPMTVDYASAGQRPVGTKITVDQLAETVGEQFSKANFKSSLRARLSIAHSRWIQDRLDIEVDGVHVPANPGSLLVSKVIKPLYREFTLNGLGAPVKLSIYAGLGKQGETSGGRKEAGWYVYCNGRGVLRADQTATTGWGYVNKLPTMHGQYYYFRGFAFFDSEDPSRVPWNTTKEGLDLDSPIYILALRHLIEATEPVVKFLDRMAEERKKGGITLLDEIRKAAPMNLNELPQSDKNDTFVSPDTKPSENGVALFRVPSYRKPENQVDGVVKKLRLGSRGEVGPATFDYYYRGHFSD